MERLGDDALQQHAVGHDEQAVAGPVTAKVTAASAIVPAGGAEQPGREQREGHHVAAAQPGVPGAQRAEHRARDEPGAVGAQQQREPGFATTQLLLSEHELGDVHRAGDEHDGTGRRHERPRQRVAEHGAHAGAGVREQRRGLGRRAHRPAHGPSDGASSRADRANVTALSPSTASGEAASITAPAQTGPSSWPTLRSVS